MVSSLGMLAGCALIMLVGMSDARGAGGRIVFSGAVVEPTCSVGGAAAFGASQVRPVELLDRLACGSNSAGHSRSYSVAVVRLGEVNISGDRLLRYFSGYVGSDRTLAEASLVVRIYE